MEELDPIEEVPTVRIQPPDVLIAEDDEPLRALLVEALTAEGLVVRAVADGDALARELDAGRWLNRSPSVVLTDLAMPGTSGLDVLARTPDFPSRPAFVVMTAFPSDDVAEMAMSLGAREVFAKPFDLALLRAHVIERVHEVARARLIAMGR